MVTTRIGTHTVEMYDAIDEMPIVRFHKYQKMLLIDAGIGSDIEGFDRRFEKIRRHLMAGESEKAGQEIENLRQCVFLIQRGINPKHLSFAVLVWKIDGKECTDLSDDALARVLEQLNDAPEKDITASLDAVKKKNRRGTNVVFSRHLQRFERKGILRHTEETDVGDIK